MGEKMKCLNCSTNIVIKRNLLNLFSLRKEYICNECYNKLNIDFNDIILPINNYDLRIYYLLTETNNFVYDSLTKENTQLYNKLKETNYFIISLNRYYMSQINYEYLEILANHLQKNITILTYELFD